METIRSDAYIIILYIIGSVCVCVQCMRTENNVQATFKTETNMYIYMYNI